MSPLPHSRRSRLLRLYKNLLNHFGPRGWWPAQKAWEMMVGAILVQNTAWSNVEKAIRQMKAARLMSLNLVAQCPRRRLEKLIRPSGYYHQKAERLQRFARYLAAHPVFFKQLTGRRKARSLPELRRQLLNHHGIGPETADSILLYAGAYPTFVVDAYTRRIGQRLGLFAFSDYHAVQAFFHDALPQKARLYNEYHALLVELAKTYCTKNNPRCDGCPLLRECAHGKSRVN